MYEHRPRISPSAFLSMLANIMRTSSHGTLSIFLSLREGDLTVTFRFLSHTDRNLEFRWALLLLWTCCTMSRIAGELRSHQSHKGMGQIVRFRIIWRVHYNDAMASKIICDSIVYSIVCSGADWTNQTKTTTTTTKQTSKLRVTGLCEGTSPVSDEFPSQKASYAENFPIWCRHHVVKPSSFTYVIVVTADNISL